MSRRPLRAAEIAGDTVEIPLRPPSPAVLLASAGSSPDQLLAAAHAEATAILAEADAIRAGAEERGHAEGMERARQEALAQVAGAVQALAALEHQIDAWLTEIEEDAAPKVVALALEVAAKVVRADVAANPERIVDVVRGGLRRVTDRTRLVVWVSPDDLEILRAVAPDLASRTGAGSLEVVDDPRIARGSCVLETAAGDVDATFTSQFARIQEALLAPPDDTLMR